MHNRGRRSSQGRVLFMGGNTEQESTRVKRVLAEQRADYAVTSNQTGDARKSGGKVGFHATGFAEPSTTGGGAGGRAVNVEKGATAEDLRKIIDQLQTDYAFKNYMVQKKNKEIIRLKKALESKGIKVVEADVDEDESSMASSAAKELLPQAMALSRSQKMLVDKVGNFLPFAERVVFQVQHQLKTLRDTVQHHRKMSESNFRSLCACWTHYASKLGDIPAPNISSASAPGLPRSGSLRKMKAGTRQPYQTLQMRQVAQRHSSLQRGSLSLSNNTLSQSSNAQHTPYGVDDLTGMTETGNGMLDSSGLAPGAMAQEISVVNTDLEGVIEQRDLALAQVNELRATVAALQRGATNSNPHSRGSTAPPSPAISERTDTKLPFGVVPNPPSSVRTRGLDQLPNVKSCQTEKMHPIIEYRLPLPVVCESAATQTADVDTNAVVLSLNEQIASLRETVEDVRGKLRAEKTNSRSLQQDLDRSQHTTAKFRTKVEALEHHLSLGTENLEMRLAEQEAQFMADKADADLQAAEDRLQYEEGFATAQSELAESRRKHQEEVAVLRLRIQQLEADVSNYRRMHVEYIEQVTTRPDAGTQTDSSIVEVIMSLVERVDNVAAVSSDPEVQRVKTELCLSLATHLRNSEYSSVLLQPTVQGQREEANRVARKKVTAMPLVERLWREGQELRHRTSARNDNLTAKRKHDLQQTLQMSDGPVIDAGLVRAMLGLGSETASRDRHQGSPMSWSGGTEYTYVDVGASMATNEPDHVEAHHVGGDLHDGGYIQYDRPGWMTDVAGAEAGRGPSMGGSRGSPGRRRPRPPHVTVPAPPQLSTSLTSRRKYRRQLSTIPLFETWNGSQQIAAGRNGAANHGGGRGAGQGRAALYSLSQGGASIEADGKLAVPETESVGQPPAATTTGKMFPSSDVNAVHAAHVRATPSPTRRQQKQHDSAMSTISEQGLLTPVNDEALLPRSDSPEISDLPVGSERMNTAEPNDADSTARAEYVTGSDHDEEEPDVDIIDAPEW